VRGPNDRAKIDGILPRISGDLGEARRANAPALFGVADQRRDGVVRTGLVTGRASLEREIAPLGDRVGEEWRRQRGETEGEDRDQAHFF
jgi:hypothetical protein